MQSNKHLKQVNDGATTAFYTYNGGGQRAKKNVSGNTTIYHYNLNGQLIAESNTSGTITAEYIYINSQPLAKLEGANTYYYHNDHLGTPQKMTDGTGTIVWNAEYKPFGEATVTTNGLTNNLRFPGQYFDAETGLHYNYFRDYNPAVGRYIEADPIGLKGGVNLYAYVKNNPMNWIDYFGLTTWPTNYRQIPQGGTFDSPRATGPHRALDIRNPLNQPVYASDGGTVIKVWYDPNGGNQILIQHDDGAISGYAHTASQVKELQKIQEGQQIGYSDDSGAGPPHLHYTYRTCKNCPKTDPWKHLKKSKNPCQSKE